jgi:pimeloyl-ACP methyl ester carboxylesterase
MPTIAANGLQIGYDAVGDGPPLVVLHGATVTGRSHLDPHLDRLSSAFRLYLPDARGHGATRWDAAAGFSTAHLVADLAGFVDALRLATFHLLGFSMGAMTALQYATEHADRLETLVLVGISPSREPRASVTRRLMDPARIDRDDPRWARDLSARHDPVQGEGAWRRLLPAIVADVAEQPLLTPAELHRVDVPTLVACGDRDPFVSVAQAWELVRALPDAHLLVAPDCGHEVLTERPDVFAAALADFYREEGPG